MKKMRLGALGLAVLSVGLLATPASADSKTVFRGKEVNAVITDCPANPAVGTRCAAWIISSSQLRVRQDGSVDKSGSVSLVKYRIKITANGFTPIFAASGFGTPSSLRVADDLSSGTMTAKVNVTFFDGCDPAAGECRTKWIPVSLHLTASGPVNVSQKGRIVTTIDDCLIVDRFNFQSRPGEGTATMNGISFVTTELGPFVSNIGRSGETVITTGPCPMATGAA